MGAVLTRSGCRAVVPIRLSLRGLLLLIALFCFWAAYHGKWIRDRDQAREWIIAHQYSDWAAADAADVRIGKWINGGQVWITADEVVPSLPFGLRILGERPIYFIHIDAAKLHPEDVQRLNGLEELFPEADGIHIQGAASCDRWPPTDIEKFLKSLRARTAQSGQEHPLTPPAAPVN